MRHDPKYYEVLRCLKMLVELKKHKDEFGKTSRYKEEQPKAWVWAENLVRSEKKFFMEDDNTVTKNST